jgi:hypothetical protein
VRGWAFVVGVAVSEVQVVKIIISAMFFAFLQACSSFYYTDGVHTYKRTSFAVLTHANKASITFEDKAKGTKNTLRIEGYDADEVQGARAIAEGVAEGVVKGMKP